MEYCTNCGTQLKTGQTRCDVCGVETTERQKLRVCLSCGTPAAEHARTCMMCGNPIDELPAQALGFGSSWLGVLVGLVIIGGLVYGVLQQFRPTESAVMPPIASGGQVFIPPTETPTPTSTITPRPTATTTVTPTPTPAPLYHKIRTGETLEFIANKYSITIDDLTTANNITRDTILRVGQDLLIPNTYRATSTETNPDLAVRSRPVITYTIQGGDTLSGIAFKFDTSQSAIEIANPELDLDLLLVGQVLLIPLRPSTATPTPTITPTPTFTPQPPYLTPQLLLPVDGTLIEGENSSVLLSWTTGGLLDDDTFYVVYLTDEKGDLQTFFTHDTSYRLPETLRPQTLTRFNWYVVVMKKIAIGDDGIFYGKALSNRSAARSFQWR